MANVLDGVPVGRIGEKARAARPGVAAATIAVSVLFFAGWLVAKLLGLLWLATAWCGCAVAEGFRQGRSPEWQARAVARAAAVEARRARAGHPR